MLNKKKNASVHVCITANLFSQLVYETYFNNTCYKTYSYNSYSYSKVRKFFIVIKIILSSLINRALKKKIVLFLPHIADSFYWLYKLIYFDEVIILDDGVSFLYSNPFHDLYVKPIISNKKFKSFLLCSDNKINEIGFSSQDLLEVPRQSVVKRLLNKQKKAIFNVSNIINEDNFGVLIDADYWSKDYLFKLAKACKKKYKLPFVIIQHPARSNISEKEREEHNIVLLEFSCESFIYKLNERIKIIATEFSTVIVNLISLDKFKDKDIVFVEPGSSPYLGFKLIKNTNHSTISIGSEDWIGVIGNKLVEDD